MIDCASISDDRLSSAQSAALRHVEVTAGEREAAALAFVAGALERAGCSLENYNKGIESVRQTAVDSDTAAVLFVTNVLNGTVAANGAVVPKATVLRIILSIPMNGTPTASSFDTIASTFPERTDPAALVIGPTGIALGTDGTLFVADTLTSRIAAIANAISRTEDAGNGITVAEGRALKQPLGLAIAPNGDILTVNAGDGLIVETTPTGRQVGARFVDVTHSRNGAGTLFGLAVAPDGAGVYFVDDGDNTLNLLR